MKVVCIDDAGMTSHLTLGMIYKLENFVGDNCRLDAVDGLFSRTRFIIVDLDHDKPEYLVGTTIPLKIARTLGQWPGQIRQKNCKCEIPPGVHCEYHGP